jgi:hypothetical protein
MKSHLLGLEVCALAGWLNGLEAGLLEEQQHVAVLALARLRARVAHCKVGG